MTLTAKLDAHAHIRIYSENEQPDLLTAILLCNTPQELARLNYLNLERLNAWPMCMNQAVMVKKTLLTIQASKCAAINEDFESWIRADAAKYGATMIVQPAL